MFRSQDMTSQQTQHTLMYLHHHHHDHPTMTKNHVQKLDLHSSIVLEAAIVLLWRNHCGKIRLRRRELPTLDSIVSLPKERVTTSLTSQCRPTNSSPKVAIAIILTLGDFSSTTTPQNGSLKIKLTVTCQLPKTLQHPNGWW